MKVLIKQTKIVHTHYYVPVTDHEGIFFTTTQ